ncbi:MAG TPA: NAD-dependent epimerase/dehydratase family protein [Lacunisphaera sp.]|jgi:nucleoside-diphosphate-sugar epimerase
MTDRKKIFLLGGTGFIGTVLTRQLQANRQANDLMMLIHRRARFQDLEQINTQTGSLGAFDLSLLDQFAPDTIIHLARMSGQGTIGRYLAALGGAKANNRIINHLRRTPVKPHTIYVSGTLVYGDCGDGPVDEDRPLQPTAFAREYLKAEKPWMDALRSGEIPVTIVRPPWIIGRDSWFAGFYLNSIKHHRKVPVFGNGQNLMSLLDVEDCAGLIAHAARNALPGRYYNLFTPRAHITQLEFAERLAKYTRSGIKKLSVTEVKSRYGKAVLEAFTFSNVASTKHPEFMAGYNFRHSSIDEMIRNNLPAELCG